MKTLKNNVAVVSVIAMGGAVCGATYEEFIDPVQAAVLVVFAIVMAAFGG